MLCVSLFVYAGYAHSACCLQAGANIQATEIAADHSGDRSDAPTSLAFDGVHCHGCAAAAVPVMAETLDILAVVTKPEMAPVDELVASDRQFEPPPPKA